MQTSPLLQVHPAERLQGLSASGITTVTSANLSWAAVSGANTFMQLITNWILLQPGPVSLQLKLEQQQALQVWLQVLCTTEGNSKLYFRYQHTCNCSVHNIDPMYSSNRTGFNSGINYSNGYWTAVPVANSYAVDYKLNTSATLDKLLSQHKPETSANLTGLIASSLYDWRVTATCPRYNSPNCSSIHYNSSTCM